MALGIGLLGGCVGDVIIEKDDLVFEGESSSMFESGVKPLKLYISALQDLRENKENTVGKQVGFRMLIPYYEKYKVDGHPPTITHRYLSDKLSSMGIELMTTDQMAQAVLKGSLKEFSRSGWGATIAWGNSAKIVVELELYRRGEKQPIWKDTIYGEGDDLEEGLAQVAENLGSHPGFKSTAFLIAGDSMMAARSSSAPPPASAVKSDETPPTILITSHSATRGLKLVEAAKYTMVTGIAKDESGIANVTVNGKPVPLTGDNAFSAEVQLQVGSNTIWVTAVDTYNNIKRTSFSVERLAEGNEETQTRGLALGKYIALVIGNSAYQHLPELRTPLSDARAVAQILEEQYGFQIQLLLDAGRDEFMDKLNEIRARVGENDNLLIYYAGHGYYDKVAQKAYWQPVDAELNSDSKWIIVDSITSNIKRANSRHILIVADSCYSGTLTRSSMSDFTSKKIAHEKYIAKILGKKSRTLMASGGNEPVSDEGGGEHSIFAAVFINALKSMDRKIFTAEDLFFNYIKEPVAGRSTQTPQYSAIRNSGHDGGDFIFHKQGTPSK